MTITVGIPQFIFLGLMAGSLLWTAARHGEKKEGTEDFPTSLLSVAILLSLLLWGGFFGGGQ